MQINNQRFHDIENKFKALQCDDSPAVWQGLILGLTARALSPEDRKLRTLCAQVLNDGQPLPGTLSALVTELALDAKAGFNKDELSVILPSDESALLTALSQLCYGLTLGLSLRLEKSSDGSLFIKVKDPHILDFLHTLQELQRVDEESELDKEALDTVLNYLEDNLCAIHDALKQDELEAPAPDVKHEVLQ